MGLPDLNMPLKCHTIWKKQVISCRVLCVFTIEAEDKQRPKLLGKDVFSCVQKQ